MNLSAFGQMSLDSPKVCLIVFFAIAEPSIDRKLAHFKAFIKQKFPELRRFARVFLGVHRQVEHYEHPHQPVSPKIHGSIPTGCPSEHQSRGSGGSKRASADFGSSNL